MQPYPPVGWDSVEGTLMSDRELFVYALCAALGWNTGVFIWNVADTILAAVIEIGTALLKKRFAR